MRSQWKKSLLRIAFWLGAEIVLNLLNLDTLSDYSEFLFEKKVLVTRTEIVDLIILRGGRGLLDGVSFL